MSQARLSMQIIEKVLRLKHEAGLSHRAIAQCCSVSPSTVSASGPWPVIWSNNSSGKIQSKLEVIGLFSLDVFGNTRGYTMACVLTKIYR